MYGILPERSRAALGGEADSADGYSQNIAGVQ
jgi:hypothetical protein